MRTPKGAVYATVLKSHLEVSNASATSEPTVLTPAQAHAKLGHRDVEKIRRTAKALVSSWMESWNHVHHVLLERLNRDVYSRNQK